MELDLGRLDWIDKGGGDWIALCPFCGENKGHLWYNPRSGVWHCFVCGEAGRVRLDGQGAREALQSKLKKQEGTIDWPDDVEPIYQWDDIRLARLCKASPELTNFLIKRNLPFEIIKRFRFGWRPGFLFFPLFRYGHLVSMQMCRLNRMDESKPKYISLAPITTFFNWDNINGSSTLTVVEGAIDCIHILQTMGFDFPIGGSMGSDLTLAQRALLQQFETVIWGFDYDIAGQNGLDKNKKSLSSHIHQFRVRWPKSDPGGCSANEIKQAYQCLEPLNHN